MKKFLFVSKSVADSFDIMGDDIELYGYYWLGVIYLTLEG